MNNLRACSNEYLSVSDVDKWSFSSARGELSEDDDSIAVLDAIGDEGHFSSSWITSDVKAMYLEWSSIFQSLFRHAGESRNALFNAHALSERFSPLLRWDHLMTSSLVESNRQSIVFVDHWKKEKKDPTSSSATTLIEGRGDGHYQQYR